MSIQTVRMRRTLQSFNVSFAAPLQEWVPTVEDRRRLRELIAHPLAKVLPANEWEVTARARSGAQP